MKLIEGIGWKAAYNEEKNVYGAEVMFQGSWDLYEITAEVFSQLFPQMTGGEAERLIQTGRCLYMHCNDRYSPPYNVVLDDDYAVYCPWMAEADPVGKTWSEEMTDAAVEAFDSQKDNREQRRKKREERKKKQ